MRLRRFGRPSAVIDRQLGQVPQTAGLYFPCLVTPIDGPILDRVYLAEASEWYLRWGVWPDEDPGKRSVSIEEVASIAVSPSRLPAWAADQIYSEGESGMGYTIFTVRFDDGSSQAYSAGNAVDFIQYPAGQSAATVAEVYPHLGPRDAACPPPDYYWCLYSR